VVFLKPKNLYRLHRGLIRIIRVV